MTNGFKKYGGQGTSITGKPAQTCKEPGHYLADPDLVDSVNAMLAVEQPLLVTGEAGTGKTMLAYSIAAELELGEVLLFPVRSDNQGKDVLYHFDNMRRFYDAQNKDVRARDLSNYLEKRALGEAICSDTRRVVLIDEIDKAPRDFPNDLLNALDKMQLNIPELGQEPITASVRPIVIITSNRESQLPDPFLRRCLFHNIEFPDKERLRLILQERLGHLNLSARMLDRVLDIFYSIRDRKPQKPPATSELITWVRILAKAEIREDALTGDPKNTPFLGSLLKIREDMDAIKGIQR